MILISFSFFVPPDVFSFGGSCGFALSSVFWPVGGVPVVPLLIFPIVSPPVVTFSFATSFVVLAFSFPLSSFRAYLLIAHRMSDILGKRARIPAIPTGIALDAMGLARGEVCNIVLSLPGFRQLGGVCSDCRVVDLRDCGPIGDIEMHDGPKMRKLRR